ncbi:hypothetical protein FHU38_005049 [Saccharomonospora amisosensis]|uniref:Uncharacterized protein n=1 Tax=Saccharomonospora amisosensis TaxID=1128677 RepID=A0A7X5ZT68_9PSEU|nr:hypothetical protein [Saccharomonospora amisosensis]NIJ14648.1 hypothetical protein [Saccharomonospora amisosensis]
MNDPRPSTGLGTTHTILTRSQWHALDDVLAEMCRLTSGSLEYLHDTGRGILETCRPSTWYTPAVADYDTLLWSAIHEAIGSLAHLEEAAPGDTTAIRAAGLDLRRLSRRMLAYPAPAQGDFA